MIYSVLQVYYDGAYHDLSTYVAWRTISTYPGANGRQFTNFELFAPQTNLQFLDVASDLAAALYDAEQGDDLVRLVRANGTADARRHFSIFSGSVLEATSDVMWWRYSVSVEHTAWGETADPASEDLNMNILYYGIDRITAMGLAGMGDRPARISEMIVHSDVSGIRIDKFWAGIKPGLETFNANIDFPNSFLGIGNERSNDTVVAALNGNVEINFNETEALVHRFESKFGFTYSPGGGNPDQTTYWNSHTLSNPEKYPGKYRLLMRWNSNNTATAFLIKVYAGLKDSLQLVATRYLTATQKNKSQTLEIGQIELPAEEELSHYSIRVSASRLSGTGVLRFGIGRIIPQEYSIYCGSDSMGVRKGQPETTLTIETDSYGAVTAYAKGAYDTARPQMQANNWSNPGGIMVVHVDARASEVALDSEDALTINMVNIPRYGLHTRHVTIVTPEPSGPIS